MKFRMLLPIALSAIAAVALWPAFVNHGIGEARGVAVSTPAPVQRDYEQRDRLVTFWEGAVNEHHRDDMLSPRELAGQYLQRYRETGDIDDVTRAAQMAERSLRIMPHNVAAIGEMASIMLTLHRFREALRYVDMLLTYDNANADFLAQKASLEMELGTYGQAATTLGRIHAADRATVASQTVQARYDELTGNLSRSRELLASAMLQVDTHIDEPAQSRAWYHMRSGELAFEAGDIAMALRAEHDALDIFPTYNLALKDLAKFELASHRYRQARNAAERGARVTPFVETLGYEADAETALGDSRAAAGTRAVILAIERIGNTYHVNDRLLAIYYADHRIRLDKALQIARREAVVRGDEIYAQDTLAWAAAMDDRWDEAHQATLKATRYHTQDPIIAYHAGIIALHFGQRETAERWLHRALDGNPQFHPVYADDARHQLALRP